MIKNTQHKLSAKQYLFAYEQILLLRRFEEKCSGLYGMGLIGGFCHLYIGQEAIIVGVSMVKEKTDSMITSYRGHSHMIMAGSTPSSVMAELTGRSTGCSKGKGGSMHMFHPEGKFYGGHGIVGAQVPIGTGIAFAQKYNNTNNICFTFLGDGALNQGQVYEAFNMAALWKLPVIYIIENNQYSMGTAVARSTAMGELYKKGESFGIPGLQVDGMNLEEIYSTTKDVAEFVRSGNGPMIIEMKSYRYRGHSMSDPAKYRSKEEVEGYKERDSLVLVKDKILQNKYADEQQLKEIEKKVKTTIAEAENFAKDSPLPVEEELYTDIFKS